MRHTTRGCGPTWGLTASRRMIAACAVTLISLAGHPAHAIPLGADAEKACAALAGQIPAAAIGLQSGPAQVDSAAIIAAVPFSVTEKGPSPSARITPATPSFCKLLGHIDPIDAQAPRINFQINLPLE